VRKKIVNLVVGTLAFGSAVAIVSHYLWPDVPIPLFSLVATGLCLVPTVITLIWASAAAERNPESRLLMALGGTAVRMALVLGVGLLLYYTVPGFERISFWIVILVFYLFTLGLEVWILVGGPLEQAEGKRLSQGQAIVKRQ
jgi:hypothetical protein